ncbi:response regulator transcription factor [Nocardia sp. Marseille-Q1738]
MDNLLPIPVRDQLERLIAVVQSDGSIDARSRDGSRTVLLDVELSGVRCTLVSNVPEPGDSAGSNLSPRELEIARMVAKGLTNKNIAHVLDISVWTVSTHLRRIFAKLGVTTRAAMVARVVESEISAEEGPLTVLSRESPVIHDASSIRKSC